jgi:hypothetical protein
MRFRIDELLAESALLRFGQSAEHPIVTSLSGTGIGGDEIEFALEADVPSTGAHAEGTLRIPAQQGGEVAGELAIHGVQPHAFVALPEIAHGDWQMSAELDGKLGEELALSIDGSFEPLTERAIGGTFTGHARIAPDGQTARRARGRRRGPRAQRHGAAVREGDQSRVRVKTLSADGEALSALLAAASCAIRFASVRRGTRRSTCTISSCRSRGPPQIESGVLEAHGLESPFASADRDAI